MGSHYDASQRVRKNRTYFYSSVGVQMGARRHASVWNGSELASSELRVATRQCEPAFTRSCIQHSLSTATCQ